MALPDGLLEVNGRIWLASFLGHDQVLVLTATRKEGDGTRDSGLGTRESIKPDVAPIPVLSLSLLLVSASVAVYLQYQHTALAAACDPLSMPPSHHTSDNASNLPFSALLPSADPLRYTAIGRRRPSLSTYQLDAR